MALIRSKCAAIAPAAYWCATNPRLGLSNHRQRQNIAGVPTHQGPLAAPLLDAQQRAAYLQIPSDLDPRVRQIAQEAAGTAILAPAQAENIADYLMHTTNMRPASTSIPLMRIL